MSSSSSDASSSSSSVEDPNPNPKPLENQLQSITLEGSNSIIQNDETFAQRNQQQVESLNGALQHDNNHEESNDQEERIDAGDARGISDGGGVVWRRTNSELEVDGPPSPSSSGYAGERGSSSATSASRIGEVSEDDDAIQEVGNDAGVDGVLDSQAAWVPGKRHVDEVLWFWVLLRNSNLQSFCELDVHAFFSIFFSINA